MKIAILGGSFDPPHLGHYWVTRQILEYRPDIEKILLVPAFAHQWKPIVASAEDRVAMLKSLESTQVRISNIELERAGVSYTIDTLRHLHENEHADLFWIVGSDILSEFDRWEKSEDLMKYASFLVFPRDPYLLPDVLPKGFEAIHGKDLITSNISSTAIRHRLAKSQSITNFVPKEIEQYIQTHHIYI